MELPIESQLQTLFRDDPNFFASLTKNLPNRSGHDSGLLTDIYDGSIYKQLHHNGYASNVFILTFGVNIDGVELFKSPQKSMWPIYLRIN
jgi:hypothetical protein